MAERSCEDLNDEIEAVESIKNKLGEVSAPKAVPPFIYKVHEELRRVKKTSYEPEICAIGPYHRGKDALKMMEEHKLRYLNDLLIRDKSNNARVEDYVAAVAQMEHKARDCYAEPLNHISSPEFVEMLVLDGCFIIQFLLNCKVAENPSDPIFQTLWMVNSLKRDMMLFENQIPFFVLCNLFDLIEAPNQHDMLIRLVQDFFPPPGVGAVNNTSHDRKQIICRLFGCLKKLFCGAIERTSETSNSTNSENHQLQSEDIQHILDLLHSVWSRSSNPTSDDGRPPNPTNDDGRPSNPTNDDGRPSNPTSDDDVTKELLFINSATELRDANVEFRVLRKAKAIFDVDFKNGIFSMPPLTIEDHTESALRNLIAYEQYFFKDPPTPYTDYAELLDCLINSSTDVKLLCERGIIENLLGDHEAIASIFNRITDSVIVNNHFRYENTYRLINKHYGKCWNRAIAKLKRNYFNSPWAYISFFAALLLLSLTIAQTVLSALQSG